MDAISATDEALTELACLRERFGPLMLFQSAGCCEGSSPLCVSRGELLIGPNDRRLGEVGGAPFYVDAELYERWNRPAFVLDVVPGAGDTFSLEALDELHFVTRTSSARVDEAA